MPEGLVFDFHRGTTHDGPGMRTTVFLKGCPLRCRWCHNPEGINPDQEIQWTKNKCIGCMTCVKSCGHKAITADKNGISIQKIRCFNCYECVIHCPAKALETVGTYWNVPNLVKEACKDQMFFDEFGGGVTVSGGEPILQYKFLVQFLKALKEMKIDTALDTSGFGKSSAYDQVYPYVDTFLFDIKFINESLHIKYTGVSNKIILTNLKSLADKIREHKDSELWIRTPLIPDATATQDNIREIGAFIQKELSDVIERWELCAFNNVCRDKYRKLNQNWAYAQTPLMTDDRVHQLIGIAGEYVGNMLVISGLTGK